MIVAQWDLPFHKKTRSVNMKEAKACLISGVFPIHAARSRFIVFSRELRRIPVSALSARKAA
jgi:hypothetical protein